LILLRKVKQFWIEGVLDKSVPIEPPLDLGKDVLQDAVEHPWEEVVGLPDTAGQLIASNKNIGDIFDELGRALLILGEPGSGKTITLLELARDLVARAEVDASQPFPVVVNLATWIDPHQTLFDWLVNEISDKYKIPGKFTRTWLEENRLLLLLDGFDEVRAENRGACVEAINAFTREYGLPGVVVSSRLREYSELPVHLKLHSAIRLKPLTRNQIDTYLARAGSKLAALQTILQKDPILRDQARSPLTLSIMSMAYSMAPQDLPAQVLAGQETENVETHRKRLFDTYIEAMFKRKGKRERPYTRKQTISWLSWLARKMIQHNQAVFLIEGIQPNWLTSRGQRWVHLLGFCLIFGFLVGQISEIGWYGWAHVDCEIEKAVNENFKLGVWVVGCTVWVLSIGIIDLFTFDRRVKPAQAQTILVAKQVAINMLIYGFTWFVTWAIISSVWNFWESSQTEVILRSKVILTVSGLVGMLMFGILGSKHSLTRDIRTAEAVNWSWSGALKGCLWGLAFGMLAWIVWFFYWETWETPQIEIEYAVPKFLLAYLIVGGEIGAILVGLDYRIVETKTVPNEGIMLTIKNVVKVGFLSWAIYGLTIWSILILIFPEKTFLHNQEASPKLCHDRYRGEIFAFCLGLTFSSLFVMLFGGVDVLKHYILRFILYLTGQTPGKPAHFLDHATRLNFLQKVGGGYIFTHRLLLEHFGAMGETEINDKGEEP
jgi:DNA polymerase III delta prime subunit